MKSLKGKIHVSDYMRKSVVTLHADSTVREAIKVMIRERTNGVVVLDNKKKVIGILSSWDIIKHIMPDYLEEDKHLAAFESADVFEQRIKAVKEDPISKFMTERVVTAKQESTLMEATALLSQHKIRQLPIVDKNGKLVGYINRTDIKLAIGEVLKDNP